MTEPDGTSEHPSSSSRTVGLALGGGALRGAAHVGVLDVLGEHDFSADVVTGTSIGAAVAALHLAGRSPGELYDLFDGVEWRDLVSLTWPPNRSLLSVKGFEELLRQHLEDRRFEDLPAPLRLLSCDLRTGGRVVLDSGELVPAVLASCALPGLFPPVRREGRLLVDGGLVEILPAATARDAGADYVVAVDLLPPLAAPAADPGVLESWLRAFYFLMRSSCRPEPEEVDCWIEPDVAETSFTDPDQSLDLFQEGQKAARRALPRLREELGLKQRFN